MAIASASASANQPKWVATSASGYRYTDAGSNGSTYERQ